MFKRCNQCNVEKLLGDFRKDKSQPSGYRYECKMCSRAKQSTYTEKYGVTAEARNKVRRDAYYARIREYKLEHPCIICSEDEPTVLEFHHIDPSEKDFQIAEGAHRNWEKVVGEINKCVVLCSNCHKKVHAGLISLL